MRMFNFTLRYKVMALLTVVPLLLLASYLFLVIRIFETDKMAYIYDTNSSVNRSIASQSRGVFVSILSSTKPIIQEYLSNGEFGILSKEIFRGDSNLLFIGIFKSNGKIINIYEHLERESEYFNDMVKYSPTLNVIINGLHNNTQIVRTPFGNDNILLIESFENPFDKTITRFAIMFKSQELTDLFSKQKHQRFYLATDSGDLLFQSSKPKVEKNDPSLTLNNYFFKQVRDKKAGEGTELIKRLKTAFLTSYNKIGYGDLLVISMIDQKKALSAIQILVTKSLLFAGLLFCITFLFSLFGSQTLTKAIRELLNGTRRIAQGDFTSIVAVNANDEIGSLATSFNLMAKEVGRLLKETAEKARMEGELQTARTVQETLFPPNTQAFETLQIAGHYEPASECGGDWWYYSKINNKVFFCIGDATGHGAPAALITSAARSAASVLENFELPVDKAMALINKAIYDVSKGQVMMTFFLGILDLDSGNLSYCNASHEPPFLIRNAHLEPNKKDLIPLFDVTNARLGQAPNTTYDTAQLKLGPGDYIFFYTDGISDIRNFQGLALGERNFLKIVLQSLKGRSSPKTFVLEMNNLIKQFRSNSDLVDDVTYFCVKYGRAS